MFVVHKECVIDFCEECQQKFDESKFIIKKMDKERKIEWIDSKVTELESVPLDGFQVSRRVLIDMLSYYADIPDNANIAVKPPVEIEGKHDEYDLSIDLLIHGSILLLKESGVAQFRTYLDILGVAIFEHKESGLIVTSSEFTFDVPINKLTRLRCDDGVFDLIDDAPDDMVDE